MRTRSAALRGLFDPAAAFGDGSAAVFVILGRDYNIPLARMLLRSGIEKGSLTARSWDTVILGWR